LWTLEVKVVKEANELNERFRKMLKRRLTANRRLPINFPKLNLADLCLCKRGTDAVELINHSLKIMAFFNSAVGHSVPITSAFY